jgi:hypothetical protein
VKTTRALAVATMIAACTNEGAAERVLAAQGFQDVEFTGYAIWGCSEDDTVHTGFRAKGADGRDVEGVVCCGLGPFSKGCTVRVDR